MRYTIFYRLMLGLLLSAILATACILLSQLPLLHNWGISALTLAIVCGIILGNTLFPHIAAYTAAGVNFSRSHLLRIGIVLYGFRITFAQIAQVGILGLLIDIVMIATTFALALRVGKRLNIDEDTVLLIGAGASICGAAAVMGAEPVVKGEAHKAAVAVATVVVFGTLAMFIYPLLHPILNLSDYGYGMYVGSTVHEVAQVVVAGNAVSESAAAIAVIEKMLRVMLLAPFLLLLGAWLTHRHPNTHGKTGKITIPWFVFGFIAIAGFNSLALLPQSWVATLVNLDTFLLAMAMAALGLCTQISAVKQAGIKPLMLAGILALFLLLGGYAINRLALAIFL